MAGQLVLIGTPLGNLADISRRVAETFAQLDELYCEDTRVTGKLLNALGISCPMRALSDDHGPARIAEAVQAVLDGKRVGYCSDAGMPGVSDPGRRLLQEAWGAGVVPGIVPGPSAVSTWLAVCPFIKTGFEFTGFAPRKPGERTRFVEQLKQSPLPVVFFESPHRIHDLLRELSAAVEPERQIMIGREMTKLYEQFALFTAGRWAEVAGSIPAQGEFTAGVAACEAVPQTAGEAEVSAAVARLRQAGFTAKDAVKAAAAVMELKPNEVKRICFEPHSYGREE
jgi:16S rRNA (cytidine1402-2'-O)-methyltransferase